MRSSSRVVAAVCALLTSGVAAVHPQTLQVTAELTTRNVRTEESNLASIVADAVRAADPAAEIAFVAASSFNEVTIPKGSATPDDILKALAFRTDSLQVLKLTGAQVRQALEHGLAIHPQRHSAFLQVSGITVTVDPSAPRDRRVVSVRVGSAPLSETKIYLVAMPAPLASGALNYDRIWRRSDVERDVTGPTGEPMTLEEAVRRYLASHRTVPVRNEERIVFRK